MNRRLFLRHGLVAVASSLGSAVVAANDDIWGESQGYPTGWGPPGQRQKWEGYTQYHVGNFSGGIESMLPCQFIEPAVVPFQLVSKPRKITYSIFATPTDYTSRYNRSALLIARGDEIWFEQYRFNRHSSMRFFGWSMTKSVLSLLFGIAMDKGLITSLDDPAQKYVKALNVSSLGDTTLRNLLNMSSGADICQDHCSPSNSFERFQ